MASNWNPDQPVIGYLTRRIRYYKKLRSGLGKLSQMNYLIEKYGKRELKRLLKLRAIQIEERINEYETAISTLNKSTNFKKYR